MKTNNPIQRKDSVGLGIDDTFGDTGSMSSDNIVIGRARSGGKDLSFKRFPTASVITTDRSGMLIGLKLNIGQKVMGNGESGLSPLSQRCYVGNAIIELSSNLNTDWRSPFLILSGARGGGSLSEDLYFYASGNELQAGNVYGYANVAIARMANNGNWVVTIFSQTNSVRVCDLKANTCFVASESQVPFEVYSLL